MKQEIYDLRSALEFLKTQQGELVETDTPLEPKAELSGVYRHIGAGGTVMPSTKLSPAMIFNKVNGHPDVRIAIGVLSSRNV